MGIGGSRLAPRAEAESVTDEKGSIPSTPILTPKVFREFIEMEGLDPRSPSKHIARTPIELLSAASEKLSTLTLDSGKLAIETPLKRHLILGIDPRSPSLEVQRTPIVVSASSPERVPVEIRNKHLDNARNGALIDTPTKALKPNPVTPKRKSDAYNRKSFILLETNIDYTETDLDAVLKEKYLESSNPRLPAVDSLELYKSAAVEELNSENIEATAQSVENLVVQDIVQSSLEDVEEQIEEIIIAPSVSLLEELEVKNDGQRHPDKLSKVTKESNKSTVLIYEDEDLASHPRVFKVQDQSQIPLGLRNGTHNAPAPKLKVSDRPRGLKTKVSKIPVVKEKRVKTQCENTPPRCMRAAKSKKSQWDPKDDTLMI